MWDPPVRGRVRHRVTPTPAKEVISTMDSPFARHRVRLSARSATLALVAVIGAIAIAVPITSAASPAQAGLNSIGGAGPQARTERVEPSLPLHDGVFKSACRYSHTAMDDPIVKPGQPGASHSHDFFGNRTTAAGSTVQTLVGKATTCRIAGDTAAYWVPSLLQNGVAVEPRLVNAYYLSAGSIGGVSTFPAGLKVVAGDSHASSAQSQAITGWRCAGSTTSRLSPVPFACAAVDTILVLRFPNCWNGTDLDSADHASHLAYAARGRCPASHPVRVPKLALNVHYRLANVGGLTLASGSVYSSHADFFNAWNPAALAALVTANLN